MADAVSFYWQWLKLAVWGAASKTRAIIGTLAIFGPGLTLLLKANPYGLLPPVAVAWLQELPSFVPWAPLILFGVLFIARLVLAPYWLYRDKPRPAAKISKEQANALQQLWRAGSQLYEKRVQSNSDLLLWQHNIDEWTSDAVLRLNEIEPGEAFSFESIGFQHRQQQNRDEQAQYTAARLQLSERLYKLRLITSRHLGATE